MDVSIHKAKAEFTKLIAAAERGEKVVITRYGRAVVEFKPVGQVGGFDFSLDDSLRAKCGLSQTPQPVSDAVNDHALSRAVLGVEENPGKKGA